MREKTCGDKMKRTSLKWRWMQCLAKRDSMCFIISFCLFYLAHFSWLFTVVPMRFKVNMTPRAMRHRWAKLDNKERDVYFLVFRRQTEHNDCFMLSSCHNQPFSLLRFSSYSPSFPFFISKINTFSVYNFWNIRISILEYGVHQCVSKD